MITSLVRLSLTFASMTAFAVALAAGEPNQSGAAQGKDVLAVATFAAGCYWCVESDFDKVDGVVETISGFMGGQTKNPTYAEVGQGGTGHAEVVQLKFDPAKVSYEKLLDYYWHHVDFLDGGGQFCDRGDQYRPVIFTHSGEQERLAKASMEALAKSGKFDKPIAVAIEPASTFTPGPDYHQDYYKTNALQYRYYRWGCGRDKRIAALWGTAVTEH